MKEIDEHISELLHAIADGKTIQYRNPGGTQWYSTSPGNCLISIINEDKVTQYRVAPATIKIGDTILDRGLTVTPKDGCEYFTPILDCTDFYAKQIWRDRPIDSLRLKRCIAFNTSEEATNYSKAILKLLEGTT